MQGHLNETLVCFLLAATISVGIAAAEAPVAVSPGSPLSVIEVEQTCPTFSWGSVERAQAYELAVFRGGPAPAVPGWADYVPLDALTGSAPLIHHVLPGAATSWTPSARECLSAGQDYVWFVREISSRGTLPGSWSAPALFRVTAPSPATGQASRGLASNGAGTDHPDPGSIRTQPEALEEILLLLTEINENQNRCNDRLDALETQVAANQDNLRQRFDAVDADSEEILDEVVPCSIERFQAGECTIASGEASVCFSIDLSAGAGLEYAVEPGFNLQGGGSVHWLPNGEISFGIETPLVGTTPPIPPALPIPIAFPDVKAGLSIAGGGSIEVCIANVSFPIGSDKSSVDEFVKRLVDALEARGGELVQTAASIANRRNLDPSRMADALSAVQTFEAGPLELDGGPLDLFKRDGKLRGLIDALPAFDNSEEKSVGNMLDNMDDFVPDLDPGEPLAICNEDHLSRLGGMRPRVEGVCELLDGLPDLRELASRLDAMPAATADKVCELIPSLSCDADSLEAARQCRRSCRSKSRTCKQGCGFLQIKCRRDCEKQKDSCIDGC